MQLNVSYEIINFLKKHKIKGRGKVIKMVNFLFNRNKFFSFCLPGYKNDIILDLSDNAGIYLFLNDGIPHETEVLSVFKHFSNSNKYFWDIGTNYGVYPWVNITISNAKKDY